ncbi:hypothetical protein RHP75_02720 [Pseudomonas sp. SG20056]|uniref:hypothetical protein n=1 Tax=Pseudomonas sp. SG20056 TaxID=3074146 RepID=UPI00287FB578|nr:hypothetical protein [Pseudomonas sp. SG20056]WNF47374.1 hypothetical protein RHP75_02720 [Pseudomonas sp. SG20056]
MITTTQTTPTGGKLQLKMNMESLQLRVELKSLLQLFGAQTSLADLAITEFGDELRVEETQEAGGSLYYLPLRLTPDFIDHILDQLCPNSRPAAIECLNKYRSAWSRADQDTAQMLKKNADLQRALRLSKRAGKLAVMLKAPKRMEAISADIAAHFTSHVQPKKMKAMVVVYDRETGEKVVTEDDNKQALTKLFLETRPETTPKLIGDVVEQIDKIVKATRFEGWQNSNSGPREIQKPTGKPFFRSVSCAQANKAEMKRRFSFDCDSLSSILANLMKLSSSIKPGLSS